MSARQIRVRDGIREEEQARWLIPKRKNHAMRRGKSLKGRRGEAEVKAS